MSDFWSVLDDAGLVTKWTLETAYVGQRVILATAAGKPTGRELVAWVKAIDGDEVTLQMFPDDGQSATGFWGFE